MNIFQKLKYHLESWFRSRHRFYNAKHVSDLPNEYDNRTIYLLGESGNTWSIAFVCPCGCGDIVQLNALRDVKPSWSVQRIKPITLYPSIWRTVGCKSHFFIKYGRVVWVNSIYNSSNNITDF